MLWRQAAGYVGVVPDMPVADIISSGRDPDRRRSSVPWRLLAGVTAAVLVVGGVAVHLIVGGSGRPPHHKSQGSLSSAALAAPSMLHGTRWRPGSAPVTMLFLGGDELRLLNVRDQGPASLTDVSPGAGRARDPLGPDAAVQQITSVAGGIVALIDSHGSAGLPDIGDVLFIPVNASGAGVPRIIARANYMALAPDHRDIWVQQAGPPWGNGPGDGPAWLVNEAGHRLSDPRSLNGRVLVAATVRGLLVQGPVGTVALLDPVSGSDEHTRIPENALIVGTDADQVAWQAASCTLRCPLHVTDVRGGPGTEIALPPDTALDSADTSDFDPAGQRLALALDTINHQGAATGTYVYVADIGARKLIRVPGGPIPVATLPAVLGAFPVGSGDVVSARWTADDSGLWIVATDGLYFQAAYWTDTGPLHVLPPQAGLAYKFDVPGTGTPGQ
jgi:hypothetical protein